MVTPAPSQPAQAALAMPRLLALPQYVTASATLGVVEGAELPFAIRRMYWLHDLPLGAVRGDHAHRQLQQLVIAMQGKVLITLDDGWRTLHLGLARPDQGLVIPAGWWRSIRVESETALICVLASAAYDPSDYIRDYDSFLAWAQAGRPDHHALRVGHALS